jgi:Sds3-like
MAFNSPSPTSPTTHGRSPPPQPVSKRDRKRNQQMAQFQDLSNNFRENRSAYFHKQIVALQHDMNLITQADPYNPEPLDDSPEAIEGLVEITAAGTPYQSEMSSLAGRWYSEFVREVNEAKEARDIELTQLMASQPRDVAPNHCISNHTAE